MILQDFFLINSGPSIWWDFLNFVLMSFSVIRCAGSTVCRSVVFYTRLLGKKNSERIKVLLEYSLNLAHIIACVKNLFS